MGNEAGADQSLETEGQTQEGMASTWASFKGSWTGQSRTPGTEDSRTKWKAEGVVGLSHTVAEKEEGAEKAARSLITRKTFKASADFLGSQKCPELGEPGLEVVARGQ